MTNIDLRHGDCLDVLAELADASVDAVVTDPPYGLANTDPAHVADTIVRWVNGDRDYLPGGAGFMGKAWDAFVPPVAVWDECLRVLKPGGHVLAFAGSRTVDLMTLGLRLAGFDIRDSVAWLYGSGFPKSLDVSKAIERNKTTGNQGVVIKGCAWIADRCEELSVTRKALDEAAGTSDMGGWWASRLPHRCALPTAEQWARIAPLIGEPPEWLAPYILPANAPGEAWALREVLGSRNVPIGHAFAGSTYGGDSSDRAVDITAPATDAARTWQGWGTALKPGFEPIVVARKPLHGTVAANVLQHGTGALNIDACRTDAGSDYHDLKVTQGAEDRIYGGGKGLRSKPSTFTPAAGRWPANVVLDETQATALDQQSGETVTRGASLSGKEGATARSGGAMERRENVPCHGDSGGASRFFYIAKAAADERVRVNGTAHPTVKPLALMRWLVRLVTPPGGTVLEPFAGSGTTVEACILEGFSCVAIEREADYLPLIRQRIARRRDPVEAVKGAGEDGGLFDLLEDGGAA